MARGGRRCSAWWWWRAGWSPSSARVLGGPSRLRGSARSRRIGSATARGCRRVGRPPQRPATRLPTGSCGLRPAATILVTAVPVSDRPGPASGSPTTFVALDADAGAKVGQMTGVEVAGVEAAMFDATVGAGGRRHRSREVVFLGKGSHGGCSSPTQRSASTPALARWTRCSKAGCSCSRSASAGGFR